MIVSCISRSKSMDTSYKNSSMNKLALGMMSTQGLDKAEGCLEVVYPDGYLHGCHYLVHN